MTCPGAQPSLNFVSDDADKRLCRSLLCLLQLRPAFQARLSAEHDAQASCARRLAYHCTSLSQCAVQGCELPCARPIGANR